MRKGRRDERAPRSRASAKSIKIRLLIAAGIVMFTVVSYYAKTVENPITGESQRVNLSVSEEIQLGLQARSEMIHIHQGLHADPQARQRVVVIGNRLLNALNQQLAAEGKTNPYRFEFHLLADSGTINAFALPGGQVFLTFALYEKLSTDGQIAGVLGHEIGHVLERHGSERIAKEGLTKGLVGAATMVGGDQNAAQVATMVGRFVSMKYGRGAELESDRWGVRLTALAGYNPLAMLQVMDVLEAAGGGSQPEILSTHPLPKNRKTHIENLIREVFPNGLPPGLAH